jgi:hypothetical protein
MNTVNVDKVLQYALLAAGEEEDYRDRQLGPIHLIKYVYLADLAFAAQNNGKTFTGTDWRFHKFGPWSFELYERIEPALQSVNAFKKTFPSDYPDKDDWIRWSLRDDSLFDRLNRELPLAVTGTVKRAVHNFGNATPDLLHYVYATLPMCNAAPSEQIDFSGLMREKVSVAPVQVKVQKTARQKKKQKTALQELRKKNAARLQQRQLQREAVLSSLEDDTFYDNIYEEGVQWLDSLAGPPVKESRMDATFCNSVWKSPVRGLNELS